MEVRAQGKQPALITQRTMLKLVTVISCLKMPETLNPNFKPEAKVNKEARVVFIVSLRENHGYKKRNRKMKAHGEFQYIFRMTRIHCAGKLPPDKPLWCQNTSVP